MRQRALMFNLSQTFESENSQLMNNLNEIGECECVNVGERLF